jgi:hypothetical protein
MSTVWKAVLGVTYQVELGTVFREVIGDFGCHIQTTSREFQKLN